MTQWAWRVGAPLDRAGFESRFVAQYLPWIEQLVAAHATLDWLIATPVHRNQKTSRLLDHCFTLALVKAAVEENLVSLPATVEVDSPDLHRLLCDYLAVRRPDARVRLVRPPLALRASGGFRRAVRPLTAFGRAVAAARRSGTAQLPSGPITLVELFTESHTPDGPLERDYYPGLRDHLEPAERDSVVYLVSPFGVADLAGHLRRLRRGDAPVLVREDWLDWSDYAWALGHAGRLARLPWRVSPFLGFDVTALVRRELRDNAWDAAAFSALLNERLMARLAERGVRIRYLVDWFENQVVDRGLNAGFRKYFPGVPSVGYSGYIASRQLLHVYPLAAEQRAGILPERLAVVGGGLRAAAAAHCPGLPVDVAPAFRYSVTVAPRPEPAPDTPRTVLVALPHYLDDSVVTLRIAEGLAQLGDRCAVRVRLHPRVHRARLEQAYGHKVESRFVLADGDLEAELAAADVLVTSASTIAFDALVRGLPVAIAADPARLCQSPIPPEVPHDVWALCFTPEEMAAAVGRFLADYVALWRRCRDVRQSVQADYFEPVTRDGVRRLLGFADAGVSA